MTPVETTERRAQRIEDKIGVPAEELRRLGMTPEPSTPQDGGYGWVVDRGVSDPVLHDYRVRPAGPGRSIVMGRP